MASIGDFFVRYRATANEFNGDLKAMAREAQAFDRHIKPLRDQAKNIGSAFSIAGTAITGSLVAAAKIAANFGDSLDEASEKTGIAVQELSKLKFAAEQTDTNFEGLSTGLKFLSKNLFEAAIGGKEQSKVFNALGVATKTATGAIRPTNEVLNELSGIFAKLPDGAEKTALSMKLFGKAGQDLIPFLNSGPEGLKALGDEAERLGIVIDPVTAKLGDEFNKALDRSRSAALGLSLSLGNALLPSLTGLIDKANNAVASISKMAQQFPNATKGALAFGAALTTIGGGLLGLAALGTLAPKVAQGFALLSHALAPATILLAVRNYGDLAAAVTLLGQASIVAKVGMLGLAGAIGVGIGQLINMGIQMAGLQPLVDKLILSMSRSLGFNRQIGQTLGNATEGIQRNIEALKARGVVVERGTMTEYQYEQALAKAMRATFGLKTEYGQVTTATNEAAQATGDYDKILRELLKSMEKTSKSVDNTAERFAELSNFLRGAESNLEAPIARFARNSIELLGHLGSAVDTVKVKLGSVYIGPLITQTEQLDFALEHLGKMREKVVAGQAEITAAQQRTQEEARRQFEQSVNEVKQSAGKIFDDMFIRGENVFKSLGNALKGGALSLGRAIFQDITGALLGPIKAAFDNFFKGILQKGLGGITGGIGNKLGSAIGGGGSVTGSVGSVAGSGAGLSGSLLSGGLAAVGGIVGGLLTKGNAKRTEEHTRETRDWIELAVTAWNPLFHQQTFYQKGIYEAFKGLSSVSNGKVSQVVTNVTPTATAQTIDASFNPVFNVNVAMEGGGNMTDIEVRDELMPKITTALETGVRGYRERWSQLLDIQSVGTPAPTF